jgi:hypothetical protein
VWEFLCHSAQDGILEQPSVSFSSGKVMNPIPHTPEDIAFVRGELRAGCQEAIHEEVKTGEAKDIRSTGAVTSTFAVQRNGPEGRKGRFALNLSKKIKHWHLESARINSMHEHALELEREEKMISFDIQAGYRYFQLASNMRDWFLFGCDGRS